MSYNIFTTILKTSFFSKYSCVIGTLLTLTFTNVNIFRAGCVSIKHSSEWGMILTHGQAPAPVETWPGNISGHRAAYRRRQKSAGRQIRCQTCDTRDYESAVGLRSESVKSSDKYSCRTDCAVCCGGGRWCDYVFGHVSVHGVLMQPLTTSTPSSHSHQRRASQGLQSHVRRVSRANRQVRWSPFPERRDHWGGHPYLPHKICPLFLPFFLAPHFRALSFTPASFCAWTMLALSFPTYLSLVLALSHHPLLIMW